MENNGYSQKADKYRSLLKVEKEDNGSVGSDD